MEYVNTEAGMMRVIIQPDGLQRILEHVPDYQIKIQDVRELDEVGKAKALREKGKICLIRSLNREMATI